MMRGRRREVDTSHHCCPNPDCASRGGVGWGHLRAHGPPRGGPWRQRLCGACRRSFLETLGTLLHGQRTSSELIVRGVAGLAEGLGIRGPARGVEVDPKTVLQGLVAAAEQRRAFSQPFLHDVRGRPGPWDERFARLRAVKAGEGSAAEAIERLERAPQGGWVARDPESTLVLALAGGARPLAVAPRVVHHGAQGLAPDWAPLLLPAGFREYLTAWLTHSGQWVQPARQRAHGPAPTPRWIPRPGLLEAPVVKTGRRRRLVRVQHRVGCGTLQAVQQVLAACGWQINTAFIARVNRSIRQHGAAVGRRVTTLCKGGGTACSSSLCPVSTTMSACPTRAYASPSHGQNPPRARALRSSGGPVRPPWRPDGPSTYGRAKRGCSLACHRGHSPRRSQP
jgi:hypothetical protein